MATRRDEIMGETLCKQGQGASEEFPLNDNVCGKHYKCAM